MHLECSAVLACCYISANAISLLSQFPDLLTGKAIIRKTFSHTIILLVPVVQVGKCTVGGKREYVRFLSCLSMSRAFIPICCSYCRLLSGFSGSGCAVLIQVTTADMQVQMCMDQNIPPSFNSMFDCINHKID